MAAVSFEETEGRLVLEIVVVVALLMSKSPVLVRLVAVGLVVVEVAGVVVVVSMAGVALLGVHLVFGVAQVAVVVHASLRVAFFCYDAVVPCFWICGMRSFTTFPVTRPWELPDSDHGPTAEVYPCEATSLRCSSQCVRPPNIRVKVSRKSTHKTVNIRVYCSTNLFFKNQICFSKHKFAFIKANVKRYVLNRRKHKFVIENTNLLFKTQICF